MNGNRAEDAHHHYDHYSVEMAKRLDGFYGRVDSRMNSIIAQWVSGETVLDIGCGFGPLTESLRKQGFRSIGVDLLAECVGEGLKRYPEADLRVAKTEDLEFPDKSFDTVVLKDVIHHVYEEDDVAEFLAGVRRVARRRIVIFDPNPMFFLLSARKLIGHVDPVCGPKDAMRVVTEAGFKIVHLGYSELFAFPLSGGYVGPVLLPGMPRWIGSIILALDRGLMKIARSLGFARFVGWRYLLVADLQD